MKKFIIILLFASTATLASTYESPMSLYKDNFFLAGDVEDQVKFQFSAKFNVFYPTKVGLYGGYTQLTHWFIYQGRDTMFSMYQPEVFYRFDSGNNLFNDYVIPYIDYLQVSPIEHVSTGVEGADHRSINRFYGQVQSSIGDVYNFGVNLKVFGYYYISKDNPTINDYKKNYTADFFFRLRSKTVEYLDKEELHVKIGGNPKGKGFIQFQLIFRILTTYIQPRAFFEIYHGYDQFFVAYDKKETSYRGGVIFNE